MAVVPDSHKISGFAVGCQAYTFRAFTAFEAVEKTAEAGGRVIEFYPNQPLSRDHGDVRMGPGMPARALADLKEHLKKHDILPVNFGVVPLPNDEAQTRRVFEFARDLGVPAITSEPPPEAMDLIERLVREFDIRVAIHNHARRPDRPNYHHWDPNFVLSLVQDRDPRIGACADTGHWVRSGIRPVDALKILEGRVLSSHLKDLNEFGRRQAHDVPYGTGVSEIAAILTELKRQGFDGNISVEYEHNWEHSVPEVAQCIGFIRGWGSREE
jgi:sugar phosphate isomerase/epimerase